MSIVTTFHEQAPRRFSSREPSKSVAVRSAPLSTCADRRLPNVFDVLVEAQLMKAPFELASCCRLFKEPRK